MRRLRPIRCLRPLLLKEFLSEFSIISMLLFSHILFSFPDLPFFAALVKVNFPAIVWSVKVPK